MKNGYLHKHLFKWVALTASLIALAACNAMAQDSSQRQFDAISRLIEKADSALENSKQQDAIRLYGATIAAYRDFSARFPDYQRDLVQFRISYCRQQIMDLLAQQKALEAQATQPRQQQPDALLKSAALCREGRFAEAQQVLDNDLKNAPETPHAMMLRATIKLGVGDLSGARMKLEHLLEADPQNGYAHYNLVQLLLREPDPDYAASRHHYQQARTLGVPADRDLETVLNLPTKSNNE